MPNNSKRFFLKSLLGAGAMSCVGVSGGLIASTPVNDSKNKALLNAILQQWQQTFEISPATYLTQLNIDENTSLNHISNIIKQDFEQDKIFEFQGFVLSQTEVAYIATHT